MVHNVLNVPERNSVEEGDWRIGSQFLRPAIKVIADWLQRSGTTHS